MNAHRPTARPLAAALIALLVFGVYAAPARAQDAAAPPADLPDYVELINAQARGDLSNDDNAFVALLPLFGFGEDIDANHLAGLERELGVDPAAPGGPTLPAFSVWAETQVDDSDQRNAIEEIILDGPWSPADQPLAQAWLESQAEGFAALEAALAKPGYFAPLVRHDQVEPLMNVLLPHLGSARRLARSLLIRAHRDIAVGDVDAALDGIEQLRRFADHTRHEPLLISNLVATSIDALATGAARDLLEAHPLDADRAERLAGLMPIRARGLRVADTIDRGERAFALDTVDWGTRRRLAKKQAPIDDWIMTELGPLHRLTASPVFDRERAKARFNALYDELVDALAQPTYAQSVAAARPIERRLENHNPPAWLSPFIAIAAAGEAVQHRQGEPADPNADLPARDAFTDAMVDHMTTLIVPALGAAGRTEAQIDTRRTLTRLAAALEAHRHTNGRYPNRLDQLDANLVDPIPPDLDGQPLRYTPADDGTGYTLRSVGTTGEPDDEPSEAALELLTISIQR
ncbi:MAG: hypothetical protein AAGE65_02200 [Planctomycetota bacterium]